MFLGYIFGFVLQNSPICNQMSVLGQYPRPDALCSEAVRRKVVAPLSNGCIRSVFCSLCKIRLSHPDCRKDLPFRSRPCMRRIGHGRSSGKLGTGIDVTPASALTAVHPIELGLSGS